MCTSAIMYEEEMDDRIHNDIEMSLIEQLEGWGFDMDALRESEGAFSSLDRRSPRAFSTNVSNESSKPTYKWDHYSGLPGTGAYMDNRI